MKKLRHLLIVELLVMMFWGIGARADNQPIQLFPTPSIVYKNSWVSDAQNKKVIGKTDLITFVYSIKIPSEYTISKFIFNGKAFDNVEEVNGNYTVTFTAGDIYGDYIGLVRAFAYFDIELKHKTTKESYNYHFTENSNEDSYAVYSTTCKNNGHEAVSVEAVGNCDTWGREAGKVCKICNLVLEGCYTYYGHHIVHDPDIEATCSTDGVAQARHCSRCDYVQSEKTTIPAVGHKFIDITDGKLVCSVCGKTINGSGQNSTNQNNNQSNNTMPPIFVTDQHVTQQVTQNITQIIEQPPMGVQYVPMKLGTKSTAIAENLSSGYAKVVKWETSDKKSVTVNKKGKIAAKSEGTARITATFENGLQSSCWVKVQKKKVALQQIILQEEKVELSIGEKYTVKTILNPITSTAKLKFESRNPEVATVSVKGIVRAVKKGTAKILVMSGSKCAILTIRVK